MSEKGKNSSFKLNVGGPSVILLLTVLGLAVFSVLAVRAAYSGLKMARTSRDAVAAYYEAEGRAQTAAFAVREAAAAGDEDRIPDIGYVIGSDDGRVIIKVPVNDNSVIRVEMTGGGTGYAVTDHRLIVDSQEGYSGSAFEINIIDIN